jgi:uncharacterized Zn finger protein (UPF0148 family)
MGKDRNIEYEGPCLCGKGNFRIINCEVQHGWQTVTPQWYETEINCPICSKLFSLEQRGIHFVLIEKSALQEKEQHKKSADIKKEEIFNSEEVKTALDKFEELINKERSLAAKHRLLKSVNHENSSVSTFRRHWIDAKSWIRNNVTISTLKQIFDLVKASTQKLDNMSKEFKEIEKKANQLPEPRKTIYTLRR